jgi:hypothetical protein
MESVILYLNNGFILVGEDFTQKYGRKMEIFVYIPAEKRWVRTYAWDRYTEAMWQLHNRHTRRNGKTNFEQMMMHDRRHKKGGGCSRISGNSVVTDYECTKNPMHDFRRSMCVQWN